MRVSCCLLAVLFAFYSLRAHAATPIETVGTMPGTSNVVVWWAISSAAKIRPDSPAPARLSNAVQVRCARNERESVQILVRPSEAVQGVTLEVQPFAGPGAAVVAVDAFEILQARYLNVTTATDKSTTAGLWPDPLLPVRGAVDLKPGINNAFWLRVAVPSSASPGVYHGSVKLRARDWHSEVPVELTIYNFSLPDQMTCQTAFGFSAEEVFRYQHLRNESSKREVLAKYWADLSAHHISPYDPAPLDSFQVKWPEVHPPKSPWSDWHNLRIVHNEFHSGNGALLVNDDKTSEVAQVTYQPLIPIPTQGLHLKGWYRTAIPGHRFTVSLNHYDANQQWISGNNRDFVLQGDGKWQFAEYKLTEFPAGAKFVRLNLMGTEWSEAGEKLGLVWFDDISLTDLGTGAELIVGGDFEETRRTELCAPADTLRAQFDFGAWDRAMAQAFDLYHFNSFSVPIPGLGGGTFYELAQPSLLGFPEDSPEYPFLLGSYCRQIQEHLRSRNWLGKAYIYWFDEPNESQYPYLQNGFNKLKQYCPDITRMITKHVDQGLVGGPNLWCAISDQYNYQRAEERRKAGDRFWWYVCTGPKAPYAGLFLDHPAPELRIWLWQTFQNKINGILVWQCNYWTSSTAYPDPYQPQNPFEDPMSWTVGYGTPTGKKLPWGNGDGRFIYPALAAVSEKSTDPVIEGPVDSIRWEQLRDGIEDYEYLTILQQELEKHRATLSGEFLRQCESLLTVPETISRSMTDFAKDGAPIEIRRDEIARAIERLGAGR